MSEADSGNENWYSHGNYLLHYWKSLDRTLSCQGVQIGIYENHILPHLIAISCGAAPVTKQRQKLVPRAKGRVLEIGVGAGPNFAFYDPQKVSKIIGLEPSAGMRRKAQTAINDSTIPIELIDFTSEEIPLESGSIDTVVTTYTVCTIQNYATALSQMRRVLKADGKLLFCEHGLAPDKNIARWQNRLNPIWKIIGGGCNLNRPIPSLIREAGFNIADMKTKYLADVPRIAGYNYWGAATPR